MVLDRTFTPSLLPDDLIYFNTAEKFLLEGLCMCINAQNINRVLIFRNSDRGRSHRRLLFHARCEYKSLEKFAITEAFAKSTQTPRHSSSLKRKRTYWSVSRETPLSNPNNSKWNLFGTLWKTRCHGCKLQFTLGKLFHSDVCTYWLFLHYQNAYATLRPFHFPSNDYQRPRVFGCERPIVSNQILLTKQMNDCDVHADWLSHLTPSPRFLRFS